MSRTGVDPEAPQQVLNNQQRMIADNYVRLEELVIHNRLNTAFTESRTYANVIMAVGYAGFFALLNFSENKISATALDLAIILFVASLSSFIFNEIFNMVNNGAGTASLMAKAMDLSDLRIRASVAAPDQVVAEVKGIMARGITIETQRKTFFRGLQVWRVCFPISLVSGYLGVVTLTVAYIYQLWLAL